MVQILEYIKNVRAKDCYHVVWSQKEKLRQLGTLM